MDENYNIHRFHEKNSLKVFLVFSNVIFLYYFFYTKKHPFLLLFIFSNLYHFTQCYTNLKNKHVQIFKLFDFIFVLYSMVYFFANYHKGIDLNIIILSFLNLILYKLDKNKHGYIYLHSFMHLLSGVILYLIYNNSLKN